ncbi:hypothetical protein AWB69_01191 [Caballeronia udeis]|uniref:Uncharacterized protein n=1 Tax=Caballeronia udeis TaxID=1232866 RepID=A0A158FHN4_9BURK|nr:hypothetical protein AWB69_01191 [Caballeronia udeis]
MDDGKPHPSVLRLTSSGRLGAARVTTRRAQKRAPWPETSCRGNNGLSQTTSCVNAAPRYPSAEHSRRFRALKAAINSISVNASEMEILFQRPGISYSPLWMDELYSQKNVSSV